MLTNRPVYLGMCVLRVSGMLCCRREATNAIEDTPMEDRVEGEGRSQIEDELAVEEMAAEDEPASDVAAQFKPGIKFKLGT